MANEIPEDVSRKTLDPFDKVEREEGCLMGVVASAATLLVVLVLLATYLFEWGSIDVAGALGALFSALAFAAMWVMLRIQAKQLTATSKSQERAQLIQALHLNYLVQAGDPKISLHGSQRGLEEWRVAVRFGKPFPAQVEVIGRDPANYDYGVLGDPRQTYVDWTVVVKAKTERAKLTLSNPTDDIRWRESSPLPVEVSFRNLNGYFRSVLVEAIGDERELAVSLPAPIPLDRLDLESCFHARSTASPGRARTPS